MSITPRSTAFLVLAGAALLAAATDAPARGPTAQERGTLDWLLVQLERDRVEDAKAPKLDPTDALIAQYGKGEAEFDRWPEVAKVLLDKESRFSQKEEAVRVLIERVRLESEKKTEPKLDPRVIGKARLDIVRLTLPVMVEGDLTARTKFKALLDALYPGNGVEWKAEDPPIKRGKAYNDLKKKLGR